VARMLNIGDKPQRFAAEGAQAAAFAKALGLKDIDYNIFIEFPREEAYRIYKERGMSDEQAAKKADGLRDAILKEGQRSTFQQDNILTKHVLGKIFGDAGKGSGWGQFVQAMTVSPFIKIPANAYWSFYNLVNPEIAMLQAMLYGGKSIAKRNNPDKKFVFDSPTTSSEKDLREARYWFAHAVVGIALRAGVIALVKAGVYRPASDDDESKKEREGKIMFEQQGTVNITKLFAVITGKDPNAVKGGVTMSNRWFGQLGSIGNTIARKYEDMTPEQREKQDEFWNIAFGGLELEALGELEQGVFSNTSALLGALGDSGSMFNMNRYLLNTIGMFTNIVHPATFAQISRAQLPYATTARADSFKKELKNTMLQRSKTLRKLTGEHPPTKLNAWGEQMKRPGNWVMRLFGVNVLNGDNFAQPIYEDMKRTGDTGFFPPAVLPKIGDQKLTTEQLEDLQEFIGQERKSLIAPFINDQSKVVGSKRYSELSDEDKKRLLQLQYTWGRSMGLIKFKQKYPEFKIKKELVDLDEQAWEIYKSLNTPMKLQLDFSEYYED
jgi:hypothetical protein